MLPSGRAPDIPEAGKSHQPAVAERHGERLLVGVAPFVIAVGDDEAAACRLPGAAEGRLGVDAFRARVEGRAADLHVFGPGRNESPAHELERAPALREVTTGRSVVGARVPARLIVAELVPFDPQILFELRDVGWEGWRVRT